MRPIPEPPPVTRATALVSLISSGWQEQHTSALDAEEVFELETLVLLLSV
jgi:hypothetical protein